MGYMRHHALIVTTWNADAAGAFHAQATSVCRSCPVSAVIESPTNSYLTVLVCPDGSKEGWEESDRGDAECASLIEWLDAQRYEDGSSALRWALVQYGDDDGETTVIDHSDAEEHRKPHKEQAQ